MTTDKQTPRNSQKHSEFTIAVNRALVAIGEKFGLYRTLAKVGPSTAHEFAHTTGIPTHHVSSWLDAQANSDYLDFDEASGRFSVYCSLPTSA
jgi:hypothetical protein